MSEGSRSSSPVERELEVKSDRSGSVEPDRARLGGRKRVSAGLAACHHAYAAMGRPIPCKRDCCLHLDLQPRAVDPDGEIDAGSLSVMDSMLTSGATYRRRRSESTFPRFRQTEQAGGWIHGDGYSRLTPL
jgi:hypothetical protein